VSSKIEWTQETWNPSTGCDRISPGCDNCYALTLAKRLKAMGQARYQNDGDPRTSGPGFGLTVHPDALDIPLRRRKPTLWFVNSMSDLFHKDVPDSFVADVWGVMLLAADRHRFQVLTKRPQRAARLLNERRFYDLAAESANDWPDRFYEDDACVYFGLDSGPPEIPAQPLPNVWLGTSIESDRYTFRADHLRETPAAVRFLSLEPLIGPLPSLDLTGIDWVIVGGESGPGHRRMYLEWADDIVARCRAANVPVFVKQPRVETPSTGRLSCVFASSRGLSPWWR
jgi:protein gp37